MKADEQRATTRSGRRILNGMSDALLELVSKQSFEQIKVNAICERADYPRATFYNYFADKYDLLDHCWARFADSMETQDFEGSSDGFHTLFDRFADLFDRNCELMKAIFAHNGIDGALMHSLTSYFTARVRESCRANHCYRLEVSGGVPQDLLADFCANTMLLIVRWTFLSATPIGREQAHDLIDQLIVNTETGCPASQKK